MTLLDVVVGYDCNLKCTYCTITDGMRRRALPTRAITSEIDTAAGRGIRRIAFTGGEPTIFQSLPALVRYAKQRGFQEIKIASNGLRYAHAPYLDHLISAGANRFHLSLHAFGDADYERTVQRSDTAPLRRAAIENLRARGIAPIADLIVKNDTYGELSPWIRSLVALGIRTFNLWLVSLTDQNAGRVEQLPKISDTVPFLIEAFDDARRGGYEVFSLHVPRCLLPPAYANHVRHPGAEGVRVITPDEVFDLTRSRLTGGVKPAGICDRCRHTADCPGLRRDYVELYGARELEPVTEPAPSETNSPGS